MTPREKALNGFELIKQAIVEHLEVTGHDTVFSIGRSLGIHESKRTDKKGMPAHEGYIAYTALAHLKNDGIVVQEGRRYRLT